MIKKSKQHLYFSVAARASSVMLAVFGLSTTAQASPAVADVNNALLNTIRASVTVPPPRAARAMAMVGISMYDSVNAATGMAYNPYAYSGGVVSGVSRDAVAYASGYTMTANLFPIYSTSLLADMNVKIDGLGLSAAQRAASMALGTSVANAFFTTRLTDGASNAAIPYVFGAAIGDFQSTNGGGQPVLPGWGNVTPFGMTSSSQFRLGPPPAVGSPEFIADYTQVKTLGCATCGTPEQQTIARFWADLNGTFTPPGHWIAIATDLIVNRSLSTMDAARLTAMVGASVGDAGISAWDNKYTYNYFRPGTAINTCTMATCGVDGDPNWVGLLPMPNHPSYSSGHATFSGSAAAVIGKFFGTDALNFCVAPDPLAGVTGDRCFSSLHDAAVEGGTSRIYGGMHYQFDNGPGVAAGGNIGAFIADNHFGLNAVPEPDSWTMLIAGFGLIGAAMRRRRVAAA